MFPKVPVLRRIPANRMGALVGAVAGLLLVRFILGNFDPHVDHKPLFEAIVFILCGFGLLLFFLAVVFGWLIGLQVERTGEKRRTQKNSGDSPVSQP